MKTEKQTQAYNLFFQTNLSQVQIAKLLDVDRKTIYNWISEGNWRKQKKLATHLPSMIAEQLYYMLANLNHEILSRGHQPWPMTHEAEQIRKLTVAIKHTKNRQTINESMESFTLFAEMISAREPELAARINPYIQEYIQQRVDIKFSGLVSENYIPHGEIGELFDYEIRPEDDENENGQGGIPVTPSGPEPLAPTGSAAGSATTADPCSETIIAGHDIPATSGCETIAASADRQYARVRPNPRPVFNAASSSPTPATSNAEVESAAVSYATSPSPKPALSNAEVDNIGVGYVTSPSPSERAGVRPPANDTPPILIAA
jgi:predicted DNA-binding protein YlxM (UPF0122 family)